MQSLEMGYMFWKMVQKKGYRLNYKYFFLISYATMAGGVLC